MVTTGKWNQQDNEVEKLQVAYDYNHYMGGVDRNDEILTNHISIWKSKKWSAFHFIKSSS